MERLTRLLHWLSPGRCRIATLDEAQQLRKWLAEARTAGETDFASLHVIERALKGFGI